MVYGSLYESSAGRFNGDIGREIGGMGGGHKLLTDAEMAGP